MRLAYGATAGLWWISQSRMLERGNSACHRCDAKRTAAKRARKPGLRTEEATQSLWKEGRRIRTSNTAKHETNVVPTTRAGSRSGGGAEKAPKGQVVVGDTQGGRLSDVASWSWSCRRRRESVSSSFGGRRCCHWDAAGAAAILVQRKAPRYLVRYLSLATGHLSYTSGGLVALDAT